MRIGMDFGTTNSGVSVFDGIRVRLIPLDTANGMNVMRSVIYLTRDHETHFGQAAIDLYNAQNINRETHFVRRSLGVLFMEHSDGLKFARDAYFMLDELEPGRLMRSLKSALATGYTSTRLYGREYTLEALIGRPFSL